MPGYIGGNFDRGWHCSLFLLESDLDFTRISLHGQIVRVVFLRDSIEKLDDAGAASQVREAGSNFRVGVAAQIPDSFETNRSGFGAFFRGLSAVAGGSEDDAAICREQFQ